jgi:hypothetical protein
MPQFVQHQNLSKCGTALYGKQAYVVTIEMLHEALDGGFNILFDGTMANLVRTQEYIYAAFSRGYTVSVIGVSVNTTTAAQRNIPRAKAIGRWVPLDALVYTHTSFSTNFLTYSSMVDNSYLYDNNGGIPALVYKKVFPEVVGTILDEGLFQKFLAKSNETEEFVRESLSPDLQQDYASFTSECVSKPFSTGIIIALVVVVVVIIILAVIVFFWYKKRSSYQSL